MYEYGGKEPETATVDFDETKLRTMLDKSRGKSLTEVSGNDDLARTDEESKPINDNNTFKNAFAEFKAQVSPLAPEPSPVPQPTPELQRTTRKTLPSNSPLSSMRVAAEAAAERNILPRADGANKLGTNTNGYTTSMGNLYEKAAKKISSGKDDRE